MHLKRIAAPTEPAVSLSELKTHLDNAADLNDSDLQDKLDAGIEYVEGESRRALVKSTWELHLSCWPSKPYLDMPLGNLRSVAWVKYTDSAGVEHAMDAADYKVTRTYTPADADADPPVEGDGTNDAFVGRVYLSSGKAWPSATLDTGDPIAIRFECGWDAASVPKKIKDAALMTAKHLTEHRSAVVVGNTASVKSEEIALGVSRLISQYEIRSW